MSKMGARRRWKPEDILQGQNFLEVSPKRRNFRGAGFPNEDAVVWVGAEMPVEIPIQEVKELREVPPCG